MHIPDGYLSPSTCAVLYAGSAPFWYVALRRLKRWLSTRLIPLLSVFAAFSFLVMMFNLPLPGGTTGHAVGVSIAAIILGPWASILAVSIALLIQALFFGDGGITTLGANCFNMAIIGSLVAYLVYRLLAGRAALTSSRRVVAAALAGYAAINASALCAAIEFGIQPLLFKDASGAPLYAPYPLRIAIPAMMIGHLTFAGLAELVLTGGVVAYFQRSNPSLLEHTAPGAVRRADESRPVASQGAWGALRPLWTALALLLALTPLGVLAGGAAWGEWGVRDFSQPEARQRIAAASRNMSPPPRAPQGLERLCSVWTAPFPQYAPAFVRQPAFGYLLSAMFGSGIIILAFLILGALLKRGSRRTISTAGLDDSPPLTRRGRGW
jgi:cobalt/nickel transport system permease protein